MSARLLAVLLGLVAVLALQAGLARVQRATARGDLLEPLLARGAEPLAVGALAVDPPGPEVFHYAYRGGAWRCASALDAPAHAGRIGELVLGLVEAQGMPRPLRSGELARAGLDADGAIRVTLYSPQGAELLVVDVGAALPGPGGGRGLVRRAGEEQALEIDASVRALLERPEGSTLPPLLDQRVLAGTALDPRRGLRRALVELPGGSSLELSPDAEAEASEGGDFAWIVRHGSGGAGQPALPERVAGWLAFLVRVPYAGFASPARAAALGLEPPAAVVTLVPAGGEPIVLELGAPSGQGFGAVLNRASGLVLLVEAEHRGLFAPTAEDLLEPERRNPWESWLRP